MRNTTYSTILETARRVLGGDIDITPIRCRNVAAAGSRRAKVIVVDFPAGSRTAAQRRVNDLVDAFVAARAHVMTEYGGYDGDWGMARLHLYPASFWKVWNYTPLTPWKQDVARAGAFLRMSHGLPVEGDCENALYCMRFYPFHDWVDPEQYAAVALQWAYTMWQEKMKKELSHENETEH